jgi:hypothetical protein
MPTSYCMLTLVGAHTHSTDTTSTPQKQLTLTNCSALPSPPPPPRAFCALGDAPPPKAFCAPGTGNCPPVFYWSHRQPVTLCQCSSSPEKFCLPNRKLTCSKNFSGAP